MASDSKSSESPNTIQPGATTNISITEAAPIKPARKPSQLRRFKYVVRGIVFVISSVIFDLLYLLGIGLIFIIPGGAIVIILTVLMIGFSLGSLAANGAIVILTGNAILRAAHLTHYTNNASAAAIGAVGGVIATFALGVLTSCNSRSDDNRSTPLYITIPLVILFSTLTGTIGSAVLLHNHVDLHGIDVLHATRAGAIGGAVLGPGVALALPFVLAVVFTVVLSPLLLAMQMGLRWVYVRSSQSWEGRTYRSSYCVCYGTCGDDPEIEEELAQIPKGILQ